MPEVLRTPLSHHLVISTSCITTNYFIPYCNCFLRLVITNFEYIDTTLYLYSLCITTSRLTQLVVASQIYFQSHCIRDKEVSIRDWTIYVVFRITRNYTTSLTIETVLCHFPSYDILDTMHQRLPISSGKSHQAGVMSLPVDLITIEAEIRDSQYEPQIYLACPPTFI